MGLGAARKGRQSECLQIAVGMHALLALANSCHSKDPLSKLAVVSLALEVKRKEHAYRYKTIIAHI